MAQVSQTALSAKRENYSIVAAAAAAAAAAVVAAAAAAAHGDGGASIPVFRSQQSLEGLH